MAELRMIIEPKIQTLNFPYLLKKTDRSSKIIWVWPEPNTTLNISPCFFVVISGARQRIRFISYMIFFQKRKKLEASVTIYLLTVWLSQGPRYVFKTGWGATNVNKNLKKFLNWPLYFNKNLKKVGGSLPPLTMSVI